MCSSGMRTAAEMASATLCMVLVHSTRASAPAPSSFARHAGQQRAGGLPLASGLQLFNFGKVHAVQQESWPSAGRPTAALTVWLMSR